MAGALFDCFFDSSNPTSYIKNSVIPEWGKSHSTSEVHAGRVRSEVEDGTVQTRPAEHVTVQVQVKWEELLRGGQRALELEVRPCLKTDEDRRPVSALQEGIAEPAPLWTRVDDVGAEDTESPGRYGVVIGATRGRIVFKEEQNPASILDRNIQEVVPFP